jgi:chromosomal replication initiation ATPase DnaA
MQPTPNIARIIAVICTVMEVTESDLPGKTTPRTKPRLVWARNMAAFVMHDPGIPDGTIARAFGDVHRITIMVRRRRMAEKLESSQRYRDHHGAILQRLAGEQARRAGEVSPAAHLPLPTAAHQPSP